jgi:hypothetical protein
LATPVWSNTSDGARRDDDPGAFFLRFRSGGGLKSFAAWRVTHEPAASQRAYVTGGGGEDPERTPEWLFAGREGEAQAVVSGGAMAQRLALGNVRAHNHRETETRSSYSSAADGRRRSAAARTASAVSAFARRRREVQDPGRVICAQVADVDGLEKRQLAFREEVQNRRYFEIGILDLENLKVLGAGEEREQVCSYDVIGVQKREVREESGFDEIGVKEPFPFS